MASVVSRKGELIQDPPLVQKLFGDPRAGWIWLLPRLWLGYQWVSASAHKLTSPAWMQTGDALKGFWVGALNNTQTPLAFDWYRAFLQGLVNAQAYTWFAKLVAIGELAVGIALIVGAFTGVAAFIGGFMNWNFMMAGSASVNPLFFVVSVGLILAWKVAGNIGADRYLLRWLGTPWHGPQVEQPEGKSAPSQVPVGAGK